MNPVKSVFSVMCSVEVHWILYSISSAVSWWLYRDFLKHLQPKILSVFAKGRIKRVEACWQLQPGSSQWCLSLHCFYSASLSARGSSLGPPQVFGHVHSPGHACGFLRSWECIGACQCPIAISFLWPLPVCPNCYPYLRQEWLKHLPVNVFRKVR